jgi:hypothetical protein
MKKTFNLLRVLPVALVLCLPVAFAQDETYVEPDPTDQTTYEAPEADTVVYDEPTTYYASVVYQSAVIYNAPVYYIAAGAALAVSYAEQAQHAQPAPAEPVSTVVVVGGSGGTYTYTSPPPTETPSVIIPFGQRGSSWFGR